MYGTITYEIIEVQKVEPMNLSILDMILVIDIGNVDVVEVLP